MSNSPLIEYTKISPSRNHPRQNTIKKITIHHMASVNPSLESIGQWFQSSGGSSNYGVDSKGRVAMYVPEEDRAWTSGNRENDHQAVTIEVANDGGAPDWHVSDAALEKTIELCVDICKRNGITKLNYTGDVTGNLTRHNMFQSTLCPGPYLQSKFPYIAEQVNIRLNAQTPSEPIPVQPTPANEQEEFIAKVGPLFTADYHETGILASVSMAQMILESGWGKSELAVNANNYFGIKTGASVPLENSKWNGEDFYTIRTGEYINGQYQEVIGQFRKYASMAQSIADHSAYLLYAKKGSALRYEGLKGETDYSVACQIIKNGGYATDPNYVSKLTRIIQQYNLIRFDIPRPPIEVPPVVDKPAKNPLALIEEIKRLIDNYENSL